MPAWMTSELRELVPVPIASAASTISTSRPDRASSRATASPTTPAPRTIQSISAAIVFYIKIVFRQALIAGERLGRRGEVKVACMINQRLAEAAMATLDLTDEDLVIARIVLRQVVALEPGGAFRLIEHQRSAGSTRTEEHTSELQSPMRNSYAVFCLKTNT